MNLKLLVQAMTVDERTQMRDLLQATDAIRDDERALATDAIRDDERALATDAIRDDERALVLAGKLIDAIRAFHTRTGLGLGESRIIFDRAGLWLLPSQLPGRK